MAPTHKLIEDALAAKGQVRIAALKAFRLTTTGTTTISGHVPVAVMRMFVVPDKLRIDAQLKLPNAPCDVLVSVGVNSKSAPGSVAPTVRPATTRSPR